MPYDTPSTLVYSSSFLLSAKESYKIAESAPEIKLEPTPKIISPIIKYQKLNERLIIKNPKKQKIAPVNSVFFFQIHRLNIQKEFPLLPP